MKNRIFDNQDQGFPDSRLLGIGLDNADRHRRITKSERFSVVGGSESTHDQLTEVLTKTFEDLDRKGKRLDETEPQELADILSRNCL